jgi:tetratricopeptide (TPR) repeat protein
MTKNLARGHHDGVQVENWDITTLAGAGAIRSTAADMLKYLRANMGKQKSKLYPAMQLSHKNSRADGAKPIVGLGWHTTVTPDVEVIWHNGGTAGYRTFSGFTKGGERGVVVLCNSSASVDDIGLHLLNPKAPLAPVKPSIALRIRSVMDTQGLDAAVKEYRDLRKDQGDKYDFSEGQLARVGNDYLLKGETQKAIALFSLNAEAHPESSSVFFGLGEAYIKHGDQGKAIEHYKKSVSLNPGNQAAIEALKKLGVNPDDVVKEIVVETETLDTYLGKYELAPGFILAVTRDGNQLKAQATGQGVFDVFPKSKNVFYLKVVDAQLTFNSTAEGVVESVTLHQGGRDLVGKRVKE